MPMNGCPCAQGRKACWRSALPTSSSPAIYTLRQPPGAQVLSSTGGARADLRGRNIGRQMLLLLLDRARQAGMDDALLEVRPSNTLAIGLYRSMGFTEIGRRRAYYQADGGREDALVLKLALAEPRSSRVD